MKFNLEFSRGFQFGAVSRFAADAFLYFFFGVVSLMGSELSFVGMVHQLD